MGSCISSSDSDHSSADVVSLTGDLRRYPLPVTASQVLHSEALSPDSSFLCNSDRLYFGDYVPRLDPEDDLEPAQIYFVLPVSKLRHRLAAADMAALAVKASSAINASNPRRSRKARVSPVLDSPSTHRHNPTSTGPVQGKPELLISRSDSRRAKSAVRSFRTKLTTINEASVLIN